MLVEKFHRFLNKAVTIADEDSRTLGCFTEAGIVAAYAWNIANIDDTDIIRSIPAIDRESKFSIDISSASLPPLNTNQADSVVKYLRLADSSKHFATEILKILIEDHHTVHRESINNHRNIVLFVVGGDVMARRKVQSNKVGNPCYQVWGPFAIVKPTGHGSYIVQRGGHPTSLHLKFMAKQLYALPFSLLPCEPVDGSDIRYLKHSHPSVSNPLEDVLGIMSYDTTHFSSPLLTTPPKFDYDRDTLGMIHPSEPTAFPSIVELHDNIYSSIPCFRPSV